MTRMGLGEAVSPGHNGEPKTRRLLLMLVVKPGCGKSEKGLLWGSCVHRSSNLGYSVFSEVDEWESYPSVA